MPKTLVYQDKFLELLNEVLRQQPDYTEGMAFVPSPAGSSASVAWGYECTTPFLEAGAYSVAIKIVHDLYEPIPRD